MAFRCLPLLFLLTLVSWGVLADGMSGEQVYGKVCINCHGSQFPRAPQLGDTKAWKPLIREGQVRLTIEGWMGVRTMPPKGGQNDLSLQSFANAVVYMARAGGASWEAPDEAMMAKLQAEEKRRRDRRHKPQ